MRNALSPLLLLPILLLLPAAEAQSTYSLDATLPTEWVNAGDGVTAAFTVRDGDTPVPAARITVSWASPATIVTNSAGQASYSFHQGSQAGIAQVTAQVTQVGTAAGPQPATSNTWAATLRFTAVDLRVTAPAGPHEPGSSVPVTVTATWRHDGSPADGIRVHALNALPSAAVTGSDGIARFTVTRASAGNVVTDAGIAEADRPHAIRGVSAGAISIPFAVADADGDGVTDNDNCPAIANANQADLDQDRIGNACDDDRDGDGVTNASDPAPDNALLARDADGDGVDDRVDRCPGHSDAADSDHDGVPDGCDPPPAAPAAPAPSPAPTPAPTPDPTPAPAPPSDDADGDGVLNPSDKCPTVADPAQADLDADGQGDACDLDDDADGVPDGSDLDPRDSTKLWDADQDAVADVQDNCPAAANPAQGDRDGDGQGDACDADRDGDGVPDATDAFPDDAREAADRDGDGLGDASDPCPTSSNRNPPCQSPVSASTSTTPSQGAPALGWAAPASLIAVAILRRKIP